MFKDFPYVQLREGAFYFKMVKLKKPSYVFRFADIDHLTCNEFVEASQRKGTRREKRNGCDKKQECAPRNEHKIGPKYWAVVKGIHNDDNSDSNHMAEQRVTHFTSLNPHSNSLGALNLLEPHNLLCQMGNWTV